MYQEIKTAEELEAEKNTIATKTNFQQPEEIPRLPKQENFFLELVKFSLVALVIVVPIRMFIAQPFIVDGRSMDPTFQSGQYLIVDQLSYYFQEPDRGEVIVFRYPKKPSEFFIKRIIGLPGETVFIENGLVTINSNSDQEINIADYFVKHEKNGESNDRDGITLGADEYFVMGDNRAASSDSRVWGALPRDHITGRAFLRLFPFNKIHHLPGDLDIEIASNAIDPRETLVELEDE